MSTPFAILFAEPAWAADASTWRLLLCTIGTFNVLAWAATAAWARRRGPALPLPTRTLLRWQLLLSAGYVLGCGYRSVFPVYDIQRLVMVDSWFSSVIVGRSVATVAELCFAAQWALLLHATARAAGSTAAMTVSRLIVPMLVVAEVCSWYSVLTTSNIGHVVEESLWGSSAALLCVGMVLARRGWPRGLRPVLGTACVLLAGYVVYMARVDVPMYWSRWIVDTEQGRHYFGIVQGVADASNRWVVSDRWADWKSEVVWMSLYFSVGVWLSIGLVHVMARYPGLRSGGAPARKPHPFALHPSLRQDAR